MSYDLSPKRSLLSYLASPGPILALLGLIVLTVSFVLFKSATPEADVDALIAAQAENGTRIKSMIGMVAGVLTTLAGALWSLMTLTQGQR